MKKYAVTKHDGTVMIVSLDPNVVYKTKELEGQNVSIEIEISRWPQEQKDQVVSYREVLNEELPESREFRNAWTDDYNTTTVDVDLQMAKEVALAELRKDRQSKFEEIGLPNKLAPELEAAIFPKEKLDQLQELRDITEPLKGFNKEGIATEDDLNLIREYRDALKNEIQS